MSMKQIADRHSRRLSETRPNLLMLLGLNFAIFSELLLMAKENCSDFDSAIPRFESWRPSHPVRFLENTVL
jgi:hypothetical protein